MYNQILVYYKSNLHIDQNSLILINKYLLGIIDF